ncbi:MAG TPA: GvpL/GvpF family gas vesicle protein, partial [Acidobacteriaceae bacterium]|nr:GvpL/GvpF family gas vesicle protein [Acidobacteriaceae bacterium]
VLEDGGPNSPKYASSPCAGKEYLSRLRETATLQRERQTKAKAVFVQVHRMFAPLEEEITCRRTDSGKMLLDIAHLIEHGSIGRYQNKYSSAGQSLRDCQMMLSGPWPPYHFIHKSQRAGQQHGQA